MIGMGIVDLFLCINVCTWSSIPSYGMYIDGLEWTRRVDPSHPFQYLPTKRNAGCVFVSDLSDGLQKVLWYCSLRCHVTLNLATMGDA